MVYEPRAGNWVAATGSQKKQAPEKTKAKRWNVEDEE
jgi:hypothetical protein